MAIQSPRILIVRLSAIGDCVLTMPLLCALRRQLPHAHISWVTQENCAAVLRGHPCLDELIEVERAFAKSPRRLWSLRGELRKRRFDIAIDPQGLFKSSVLAWLSGAPQRIGNAGPLAREGSQWLNNTCLTPQADHIIDHQLELLAPLGVQPGPVEFRLPIAESSRQFAEQFASAPSLDGFGILNPGAAWASKTWPREYYAKLARRLHEIGSPAVVMWGGAQERELAEQVVERAGGAASLAPATTLNELAAVCERAAFFVGSDTGPLHIAEAVGAPCVSLQGTTMPHKSGPYGPRHIRLQEFYQGGTTRERRMASNDAMRAISVDKVFAACQQLVGRRENASAPAA